MPLIHIKDVNDWAHNIVLLLVYSIAHTIIISSKISRLDTSQVGSSGNIGWQGQNRKWCAHILCCGWDAAAAAWKDLLGCAWLLLGARCLVRVYTHMWWAAVSAAARRSTLRPFSLTLGLLLLLLWQGHDGGKRVVLTCDSDNSMQHCNASFIFIPKPFWITIFRGWGGV